MKHDTTDIAYLCQDRSIRLIPLKPDDKGMVKVPLFSGWRTSHWDVEELVELGCCGPRQRPDRGLGITGTRLLCVDCDNGNVPDVKALIEMTQPLIYYPSFRKGHGHIIFDGQPQCPLKSSSSWAYRGAYGEIKGIQTQDGSASYFALWNSPVLVQAMKTRTGYPLRAEHYTMLTTTPSAKPSSPTGRKVFRRGGGQSSGIITQLTALGYAANAEGLGRFLLDEGDNLKGRRNTLGCAAFTYMAGTHQEKDGIKRFLTLFQQLHPDMTDELAMLYETAMAKAGRKP